MSVLERASGFVLALAVLSAALPAAADPTVAPGDLTHLIFTATSGLETTLLSPRAGDRVPSDRVKVDVQTVEGAGVELAVNGTVVPAAQIGERTVDGTAKTARYTYYSVPFVPGSNDVVVTALGAGGLRGVARHAVVFGAGTPAGVSATLTGALVADGRSSATLAVSAIDGWHRAAARGAVVRVTVVAGDASVAMISEKPKATSRAAEGSLNDEGAAIFRVVAGTTSGNVTIAIAAADARARVGTFVAPYLRKAFVTGLVSGGLGATPGNQDGDGNYDNGGSRRARAALFATGEVLPGTSLQFAYDTASHLAPTTTTGPYTLDPAQQPYSTYGDTSVRRDDALSAARMFLRLEHDRDSYTYGRFIADIGGETSASSYQQVLSGSRLELANRTDTIHAVAFNAANNVAYARRTIPVTGLASLGQTLDPNIVVGSDLITLVATDRRTGAVLSQTPLVRNVDYVIDYTTGVLRFLQIPLPFDGNGNPQFVVAQYQYAGVSTNSETTGGKLSAKIGATTVRAGYVNDATGSGNFALFEQGITGPLAGGAWSFTHASASGVALGGDGVASSGQSYRLAVATVLAGTRVQLGYDATGAGYQNPFGGFATPGLTDYVVTVSRTLGPGELTFNANGQRNAGVGTNNSQAEQLVHYTRHVGPRLALAAGVNALQSSSAGNAIQAQIGATYRVGAKSTLAISRLQNLGGTTSSSQPAQTQAGIDFAVDANTHVFLRETWLDSSQTSFANSSATVAGTQGDTRLLQFGVDRKVGPNTDITSQYTVNRTINGSDFYSTSGVRETLAFGPHLKGDAFFQSSTVSVGAAATTGGGGYTAYGSSMAYSTDGFHATSAFQNRAGAAGGYGLELGAGGALTQDLALVGTLDQSTTGGIMTSEGRAGVAFRPHADDREAALLEFDRVSNDIVSGTEITNTVSFEEAYRPHDGLEIDGRFAYKIDGDAYYAAHSMLLDLRVDQRIGSHADVAVETRTLRTPGIAGATTTGFAVENGWRLGNTLRLAGGYNVTGTADPLLAVAPAQRGFYVTMTSVVTHAFGWGK